MIEIDSRDELISALRRAAALEHSVVCRYLFAGFSLKTHVAEGGATAAQLERVRTWQATLFRVAREEMEHMGLACNLLTAVGGAAHVRRPEWSIEVVESGVGTDLRRFDETTLAEFAEIERSHAIPTATESLQESPTDVNSAGRPNIGRAKHSREAITEAVRRRDTSDSDGESIGELYTRIREGLGRLSRQNSLLFVGPVDAQVSNESLDLPPGWFNFNLHRVDDLATAERAIDQILEASHEPTRPSDPSHADAFEQILEELHALRSSDPAFEPARPVAPNPTITPRAAAGKRGTLIRHPLSRRSAALFNLAYETMLLMLGRYYAPAGDAPHERAALQKSLFFPLMTTVVRPLGELLTRMPIDEGTSDRTAGAGFEVRSDLVLPPDALSAWTVLHERLRRLADDAARLSDAMHTSGESWTQHVDARLSYLAENLARLALNFERNIDLRPAQVHHLFKKVF